jgi:hypothetical protein
MKALIAALALATLIAIPTLAQPSSARSALERGPDVSGELLVRL